MNTGWNPMDDIKDARQIINLLGNEYWLELFGHLTQFAAHYKPTGK